MSPEPGRDFLQFLVGLGGAAEFEPALGGEAAGAGKFFDRKRGTDPQPGRFLRRVEARFPFLQTACEQINLFPFSHKKVPSPDGQTLAYSNFKKSR
jgi:hypothetical protein